MTETDIRIYLYGILGFLAVLFLILVCYGIGGSLVENLFTTVLGSAFTVFVVDNLLRLAERRRTAPGRFAAHVDALILHNRCRSLWVQMLVAVLDEPPSHEASLYAAQYCVEVCTHLDLDKPAPVVPSVTWRNHICDFAIATRKSVGDYFGRYIEIADMRLIGIIHQFERCSFLFYCTFLRELPLADSEIGVNRAPILGSGTEKFVVEFLSILQELRSYLEETGQEFADHRNVPRVALATFSEDLRQFTPPRLGVARFDQQTSVGVQPSAPDGPTIA
jgi:hypothetical protein